MARRTQVQQMKANSTHNRVAIFHSVEYQVEPVKGEWMRDSRRSTKPIADIVNEFLAKTGSSVVAISPPAIELIDTTDKKTRTYRCSVSIIYQPQEIVHDQTSTKEQPAAFNPDSGINLDGIGVEYREQILRELKRHGVNTDGSGQQVTVSKPKPKPGVAKQWADEGKPAPVPAAPNKFGNGKGRGRNIRKLPGISNPLKRTDR